MGKPWEEVWMHVGDFLYVDEPTHADYAIKQPYYPLPDRPLIPRLSEPCDRARLAAAAPDLYRALAAIQWSGELREWGESYACCPSCKAVSYRASGYGTPSGDETHRDGCALAAALRKARGE